MGLSVLRANLSESQVGEAGPPDSPKREEEEDEWLLLGGELRREEGHRSSAISWDPLERLQYTNDYSQLKGYQPKGYQPKGYQPKG